ncbi:hypothetical protein BCR42DRAFT_400557 [Absidia repens]|uniref:Uncharacterized protein n=1 Tax=Absidia repens TaxID=90262 RepID=A0A1X2J1D6_9FUNG|nr:hypothetical protein BCR42DRAFT_400557 [Absidia repens]
MNNMNAFKQWSSSSFVKHLIQLVSPTTRTSSNEERTNEPKKTLTPDNNNESLYSCCSFQKEYVSFPSLDDSEDQSTTYQDIGNHAMEFNKQMLC